MELRKTKIVCSIGPCSDNDETIRQMIRAGMDVARFNFSHGTYDWHKNAMERVRRIAQEEGKPVAILLDTKGPEIRTGNVQNGDTLKVNEGEIIELTGDASDCTAGNALEGKNCHISISWPPAKDKLKPGMKVLICDGLLELEVFNVKGDIVYCKSLSEYRLGSKKNVNLVGVHPGLPILSQKDKDDLRFGAACDIDFVAASFVSFPEEVVYIKDFLQEVGAAARVIAKIENEEGLNNIKAIAKEADGIMVARGDLGMQLPIEKIPLAQKAIIAASREAGKSVITATQMLDSMINSPRPTRAELTDVANAVFDGTDAVMLSGETAGGRYPVEAVRTMAQITLATENSTEYLDRMKFIDSSYKPALEVGHSVAHSAYNLARNLKAKAILIPTLHGNTARMIATYRPEQIVIAVTPDKKVERQLMLQWGVLPYHCNIADDSEAMVQNAVKLALDNKAVQVGDKVVMCAGIPLASPLMANTIKVLIVGNVLARGTIFGFANEHKKRVSGRIVQAEKFLLQKEDLRLHHNTILVLRRITEASLPLLRIADGVIAESSSDISAEQLALIGKDLVWIQNVPAAQKLENELSVTLDGEQGLVYEGII